MSAGSTKQKRKAGKEALRFPMPVAAAGEDGKHDVPTEFRIFAFGINKSEKGDFIFDEASAASVMELYAEHNKPLVMDYNHGSIMSGVAPEVSINSAESFIPEVRPDGLYATQIKWTSRARDFIAAGEYTLFSPYFEHDADGRVTRLINCAITNLPALDNIQPLVAASANEPDKEKPMPCEACTAKDAALTAANAQLSAKDAQLTALTAELSSVKAKLAADMEPDEDDKMKASALTKLTALTGQAVLPAALGTIEAWKTKAEGYDKLAEENARREAEALRAELTAVLDEGAKDGKVPGKPGETGTIRASLEAAALAIGGGKPSKNGNAWLSAHVAALPKAVSTTAVAQPANAGAASTPAGKAMSKAMGIDEAKFVEWQAKQNAGA